MTRRIFLLLSLFFFPMTAHSADKAHVFCFLSVAAEVWHTGPCDLQKAIREQPIGAAAAFVSSHGEEIQILSYSGDDVGIRIEKGSSGVLQLAGIGEKKGNCFVSIAATFCYYKTAKEFSQAKLPPDLDPPALLGLPDFPVDKGCDAYAKSMQAFSNAHDICLQGEQSSYDQAKSVWETVPRSIQELCYDEAGENFLQYQYGSPLVFPYTVLINCLGVELRKQQMSGGFQK